MSKINVVLEGRYKGYRVRTQKDCVQIDGNVTKDRISSYEVIDESNKDNYSFWKGVLGVALLGEIGTVIGIGSNKKEYLIAIEWKDHPMHINGTKSLICIDERCYKTFIRSMF